MLENIQYSSPNICTSRGEKNGWEKLSAKPSEQLAVQIHFHVSAIKGQSHCELLMNFCRATLCTSSTKVVSKANRLANWLLAFLFHWLPNKNCTQRFSRALQLYENINRSGTMSTPLHCRKMFPCQNSFPPR